MREPGELRQYFERKRAEGKEADPGGQCSAQQARASRVRCDPEQQALRTATDNNDLNH
ncbi:MAG: hypothetical protein IPH63_17860 [Flavobacteriales bacterium]|nr:hypothetical protein [Flavobacteriales bacterium]